MDVLKSRSETAEENIKDFCFQQHDQPGSLNNVQIKKSYRLGLQKIKVTASPNKKVKLEQGAVGCKQAGNAALP